MKISTYSSSGLSYLTLDLPDYADRLTAYAALQAHYASLYGEHVVITVLHLCSTPDDPDEGTVAHSASVTATCEHGLTERIATVNVVTKRKGRT